MIGTENGGRSRYYFILCRDLGFRVEFDTLVDQATRVARLLQGLINAVEKRTH